MELVISLILTEQKKEVKKLIPTNESKDTSSEQKPFNFLVRAIIEFLSRRTSLIYLVTISFKAGSFARFLLN